MNVFRLCGDISHLFAIVILLLKIWKTRSCAGISGRSQLLFALVFSTRYLDLFTNFVSPYNSVMKVFFLASSYGTIYLMWLKFKATYDKHHDTFRIEFLVLPCIALALVLNHSFTVLEVLWTFSIYLEAVAILPQLFMLSKTGEAETITSHYLFALGIYRALYIANWIYRYYMETFFDPISVIAGVIQTVLYADFFYLYITRGPTGLLDEQLLELPIKNPPNSDSDQNNLASEFEEARPTSIGEEELQLQIALAMSKEEADRENEARRGDDVRLQMALDESKQDGSEPNSPNNATLGGAAARDEKPSAVDDLLSLSLGQPPAAAHNNSSGAGYPQLGGASMNSDPWAPAPPAYSSTMGANSSTGASSAAANDPWGGAGGMVLSSSTMPRQDLNGMGNGIDSAGDPWAPAAQPVQNGATAGDPWASLSSGNVAGGSQQPRTADELMNKRAANKTPESFLGENSNLVNLDDLLGATKVPAAQPAKSVGVGGGGSGAAGSHNPFLSSAAPNPAPTSSGSSSVPPASNPFVLAQRPSPTLNQMRYENNSQPGQAAGGDWALAQPMAPTRATNPFV